MEKKISRYWSTIQASLFPGFCDEVGHPTQKHGQIMVVLDVLDFDRFHHFFYPSRTGRPRRNRIAIAKAFVAKSVLNLPSTEALLDRLRADIVLRRICGFESNLRLPCKATFSNAFNEFSELKFPEKVHNILVKTTYNDRVVGHISRDATDISARGKVAKVAKNQKGKRKNRRRRKNRRIVQQLNMSLDDMINDLPKDLNAATKRGHSWKGFKLHLDVADGGIPISAIVTSASVHDCQVAIPLEEKTNRLVTSLYSLMDSAYDAKEIRDFIASKHKVAIIEPHNRQGQTMILDPAERSRYEERTTVERAYARIKDNFGGRQVMVKSHAKVFTHLMFGIVALAAEQIVRSFT